MGIASGLGLSRMFPVLRNWKGGSDGWRTATRCVSAGSDGQKCPTRCVLAGFNGLRCGAKNHNARVVARARTKPSLDGYNQPRSCAFAARRMYMKTPMNPESAPHMKPPMP